MERVTRFTDVSHIGQGNTFRRDNSRSTHDIQLHNGERIKKLDFKRQFNVYHAFNLSVCWLILWVELTIDGHILPPHSFANYFA